jgi:tRNA A-37 threonylcarbamoyl transferase component Bud32
MKQFNKIIVAKNARKIEREVEMQQRVSKYGFTPPITNFKLTYNESNKEYIGNITMEHLDTLCLADMYSDDPEKIPVEIWDKIRKIVQMLYNEEGIEYIDITGYNFIEKDNKIYIIDFGDAKYTKKTEPINWFLQDFLNGYNGWNPDYK